MSSGWVSIGCSSTPPRLKSFGALPVVVSIRSWLCQSELAPFPFCRFPPSGILAFTLTLTLLWRRMSRPLFGHASPHSNRSAGCGVLCLNTPCWYLSVLLWSARSTIAAPCWPVSPVISWADNTVYHERRRSSDLLRQKIRARHSAASRSSLAAGSWADPIPTMFWHSGVSMVLRRHTWPSAATARSKAKRP